MKATIAGITYEGTPEEISAMLLIQQAHSRNKPFKQPEYMEQRFGQTNVTNPLEGVTGCKNIQCFCDGSCRKPKTLSGIAKSFEILDGLYDKYNT